MTIEPSAEDGEASEALMVPSPNTPKRGGSAWSPSNGQPVNHMLVNLPFPREPALGARMTSTKNERKMQFANKRKAPMKIVLATHAGLFADAFGSALVQLAAEVEVEQLAPERLGQSHEAGIDLLVVDVDSVSGQAVEIMQRCNECYEGAALVALGSALDDASIAVALNAGAQAYLLKSYSLAHALGVLKVALEKSSSASPTEEIDTGEKANPDVWENGGGRRRGGSNPYGLTKRELQVLTEVVRGHANYGIAKRLGIVEGTVKIHLSNAYKKLGVENRTQAMRIVERMDYMVDEDVVDVQHPSSLRDWLLPHMAYESHRQGALLFKKGDPAQALYFIQHGTVALPEIEKELAEGALFGEMGIFLPEHTRSCSARCETDADLFRLTAVRARRLFFENPEFAYHVMQLIASNLREDQRRSH